MFDTEKIKSKDDLVLFLTELQRDYENGPDQWVNQSIDAFLEAICAWIKDTNMMLCDDADWAKIAALFLMGKMYE